MRRLEGSIQALVTGSKCEERGCKYEARWYVSMGEESYHYCSMHTVCCMEETDFWRRSMKVGPRTEAAKRAAQIRKPD